MTKKSVLTLLVALGTSAASSTRNTSSSGWDEVHAAIASSRSFVRFTRPSLVASAGSSARSARPIARIIRLKIESAFAPITTYLPSAHG